MTSIADDTGTAPDAGVRFQPPTSVVLKNAHVVVSAEQEFESASIVIKDGKILAVGPAIAEPSGAEVIDCRGKFLYPAFIDAMVEFESRQVDSSTGYWNSNITPEREMDRDIRMDAAKLEALRKAGIGLLLAAPKGGIIKGRSCVISSASAPLHEILVRSKAFQHIRLYPDRNSQDRYPNSPMGATALVRQAMLDADWYRRAKQAVTADPALPQPEHNVALEALEPASHAAQVTLFDGTNELYALRADRLAREFSLKLVVRGSGREYRQIDAIAATGRTFIIPVAFPEAPKVTTATEVADATLQSLMHWRLAPENPGRLEKGGVEFALTTDGLSKPTELLSKLRVAIERGLSKERALRALTEAPARLLEVEHLAGTLEAGKLANILITSGRLFDKSTEIEETWVQGHRYRWKNKPSIDLRGRWKLSSTQLPTDLVLEFSGKPEKLVGKIGLPQAFSAADDDEVDEEVNEDDDEDPAPKDERERENENEADDDDAEREDDKKVDKKKVDKRVEIKDLSFNDYVVSGTFEAKEIRAGQTGRAWLSAVVLANDDKYALSGSILWPDGSSLLFINSADKEELKKADSRETTEAQEKQGDTKADDSEKVDAEEASPKSIPCELNFPLGAYGRSTQPEQPELLLIQHATIWTCEEEGILESADLLVRRGIIESIGQNLAVPDGAVIMDATGLHVSPGIIDCHSHMGTDGGVNESAQAVTAEVRIGDFIDPNDITIYRHLAGGVTCANILHGSANPIGGQNQVIKLRWGSLGEEMKMKEAPAGIKFALGENVKQSNSSGISTRYPQTRMGVEQIMRDRFEAAKHYRQQWQAWSSSPSGLPPRRDLELDAIAEILEGKRWIHCHSYRQDEILMMLRLLDDYGVTIGSLQHILEGYKVADAMAAHGATGSSFSDWWAYKAEVFDAIPFNGALMHRAGVIVSFNSDDSELARHLNHEAAKAVKYGGVEPTEALKFVTLNPAKQLRIDEWIGSLKVGKQADFVIWNRSPLSTMSVCTQTWIDGRKYFDRDEDIERRKADAILHRQLVQAAAGAKGSATNESEDDKDPSTWWARHDEFCHHVHDD